MTGENTHITLRVSVDAWDILKQALELDSRSTAATPELRQEIQDALAQVKEVEPPKLVIFVGGGLVQDTLANSDQIAVRVVDGDNIGLGNDPEEWGTAETILDDPGEFEEYVKNSIRKYRGYRG